jgi:uncharacterized protein with ParB-like and HNH nuclease domain
MKAKETSIKIFFSDKSLFIIPVYQRDYVWAKNNARNFLKTLKKLKLPIIRIL